MNSTLPDKNSGRVYFDNFDRITIGGVPFKAQMETSEGYLLVSAQGHAITQFFSYQDLQAHNLAGDIRVERNFFHPKKAKLPKFTKEFELGLLR